MRIEPNIPAAVGVGRHGQPTLPASDHLGRGVTLSADEQAYFAELERLGPLVYGRRPNGRGVTPPPVLGQRGDGQA